MNSGSDTLGKKILILTAHYGAGHIKVSEALQNAFNEENIHDVVVLDFFDQTVPKLSRFVKTIYLESLKKAPQLYGAFYQGIGKTKPESWVQKQLNQLGYDKLLGYLKDNKPEIVVCTYPIPAGVVSLMKHRGDYDPFLVTVPTDYRIHSQWIHLGVDLYVVANEVVKDDLINRDIDSAKLEVTGLPINPDFYMQTRVDRDGYGLKSGVPVVLVMSGGYGMSNIAIEIVETISKLPDEKQIVVICGHDKKLKTKMENIKGKDTRITALGFVDNVEELMSMSDVLVSKAGAITITEALAKQLPIVLYKPLPGQETENAEFVSACGAGVIAKNKSDLAKKIQQIISDPKISDRMKAAGSKISSKNAAKKATKVIIERYIQGADNNKTKIWNADIQ